MVKKMAKYRRVPLGKVRKELEKVGELGPETIDGIIDGLKKSSVYQDKSDFTKLTLDEEDIPEGARDTQEILTEMIGRKDKHTIEGILERFDEKFGWTLEKRDIRTGKVTGEERRIDIVKMRKLKRFLRQELEGLVEELRMEKEGDWNDFGAGYDTCVRQLNERIDEILGKEVNNMGPSEEAKAHEAMAKAFEFLKEADPSRENSLAKTKLEEAIMWNNKDGAIKGDLKKSDTFVG